MPETPQVNAKTEARKIYAALFGREIPPVVEARFVSASERLNHTLEPRELDRYYRFVAACDDLEAVEVAGRYTHRLKLLSRKLCLMTYLAETQPEAQGRFVNENSSLCAGLWQSVSGTLRTILKLLKGLWLLRGYADA